MDGFLCIGSGGCDGGSSRCEYTYQRIAYIGSSFFQLHRLLHSHGEGTDRRTLRKKEVLVSGSLLTTRRVVSVVIVVVVHDHARAFTSPSLRLLVSDGWS